MNKEKRSRRQFLKTGITGLAVIGLSQVVVPDGFSESTESFDLLEISVPELQAKLKSGAVTSRVLTEKYIARIKEIDPKIKSVVEINPDALAIADRMDKERKRGKVRSALHGIPVLIKDNIDTADKMKTTAGSLALMNAPTPKADAFIVKQLRAAGAVILGKTNLSEWANFRSTKSTSGWSGRGGQTNNPYG